DYVRDRLGFQTSWSKEHYEKGKALAGYQTSAHFLMYLEGFQPTIIKDLSKALIDGTYSKNIFKKIYGKSLAELIEQYERENGG
ncbi:MAG: hypothetical protein HYW69_03255, partial [Candidatus Nealsonbacteria bacterium]|nr:hypothetical protein [Candidatus Nealsonbacteria bacterium]